MPYWNKNNNSVVSLYFQITHQTTSPTLDTDTDFVLENDLAQHTCWIDFMGYFPSIVSAIHIIQLTGKSETIIKHDKYLVSSYNIKYWHGNIVARNIWISLFRKLVPRLLHLFLVYTCSLSIP